MMPDEEHNEVAREYLEILRRDLAGAEDVRPDEGEDAGAPVPLPRELAEALARVRDAPVPASPCAREVWTVPARAEGELGVLVALLDDPGPEACAVLVSDQLWLATTDDVVVPPEQSPTGEPLLLCLWCPVRVESQRWGRYVGRLPRDSARAAELRMRAKVGLRLRRRAVGNVRQGDTILVSWELRRVEAPEICIRYLSGGRLGGEDDIREQVRVELKRGTAHLAPEPQAACSPEPAWRRLARRIARAVRCEADGSSPQLPPGESDANAQSNAGLFAPLSFPVLEAAAPVRGEPSRSASAAEARTFRLQVGEAEVELHLTASERGLELSALLDENTETAGELQVRVLFAEPGGSGRELAAQASRDGVLDLGPIDIPAEDGSFSVVLACGQTEARVEI